MQFYSQIKDGKLQRNVSKAIAEYIGSCKDGRYEIEIKKQKKKRSLDQNGYYWGVVVYFFIQGALDTWGEDIDSETAHAELKKHCNYKEVINVNTGEINKLPLPTKDLTTVEFELYQDKCRKFIYEWFNIIVPLPNENLELIFQK